MRPISVVIDGVVYVPEQLNQLPREPVVLGQVMKQMREGFGWTLEEASSYLSCSKSYLWALEKGESLPSFKFAINICKIYRVSLALLALGVKE